MVVMISQGTILRVVSCHWVAVDVTMRGKYLIHLGVTGHHKNVSGQGQVISNHDGRFGSLEEKKHVEASIPRGYKKKKRKRKEKEREQACIPRHQAAPL